MKIIGIIISVLFMININPSSNYDWLEIIEVAEKENITVNSWKIYIKKSTSFVSTLNDTENEIEDIIKQNPEYSWEMNGEKTDHHYKVIGRRMVQSKNINELATITVFHGNDSYRILLSIEITGDTWTKHSIDYLQSEYKNELNHDSVYYTVYGSKKSESSKSLEMLSESILKNFSAERIEDMKERNFMSVSAFVQEWDFAIPTQDNKEFNLQFGLRLDPKENIVNVVIGTPVITSGY